MRTGQRYPPEIHERARQRVREYRQAGMSMARAANKVAHEFGVSKSTIYHWCGHQSQRKGMTNIKIDRGRNA